MSTTSNIKSKTRISHILLIIASFFLIFYGTQLWLGFIIGFLTLAGVDLEEINQNLLNTVAAFVIYFVSLVGFYGLLRALKFHLSTKDVGLFRLPSWTDISITPLGFIVYFALTTASTWIVGQFFPAVDLQETQDIGFTSINSTAEYVTAFITLVVLAPIAEEILFRGYLFGALRRYIKPWQVILLTSLIFGFVHDNINLMIDTFILGLVLGTVRQITSSIWASVLLHMTKNGLAFYLLFINTTFPL